MILRHRINSSEFKWVDFLASKFVLQVSCGQQHTICRAVDRSLQTTPVPSVDIYPGSSTGANVYTWGNNMLGQLGLGMRGTSKGKIKEE